MNIVNANAPQLSKLTPMALKNRLVMASRFKMLLPAAPELADILDTNSEDKGQATTVTIHDATTRFTFRRVGLAMPRRTPAFTESNEEMFGTCHWWQGVRPPTLRVTVRRRSDQAAGIIRAGTWCIIALLAALPQSGCTRQVSQAEPAVLACQNAGGPSGEMRVHCTYVRLLILGDRLTESRGRADALVGIVNGASGTIVDARGYVVTAAHIATSVDLQATATTPDGRAHEAVILRVSPERELALLKIEPFPGIVAAELAQERSVRRGDRVFAIGTPDNVAGVVASGEVHRPRLVDRVQYGAYGFTDAIELEIDASPGFSGGPVFNRKGKMIGMMAGFGLGDTSRMPYESPRLGYAVPASAIRAYLAEVIGAAEDPGQE